MKNLLFFISLFLSSNIIAQQFHSETKNYLIFADSNYFEKIFLHTDKDIYYTKENIWFKAYIFNAKNNKLDSCKQLFFLEFINPEKNIIFTKKYWLKNGSSNGNLFLPDSLNQGTYQLRAYTFPMKNYSSKFFFSKNIYIYSKKQKYSLFFYQDAKKYKRKIKKIYVDYSIESGNMVNYLPCKIIYHLRNFTNNSLFCNISIIDKNKNVVAEQKNSSIGELFFIPKPDEKYFIIATKKNYYKSKTLLPIAEKKGIVINKKILLNRIILNFYSNQTSTNDSIAKTYLLLGESNGKIYFSKFFLLDSLKTISINKNKLNQGVINFSLINLNNKIVASIPVLILFGKKSHLQISTKHENDTLYIKLNSLKKISTNLSLSITSTKNYSPNIEQYFNLISETPYFSEKYNNLFKDKNNSIKLLELYYKERYPLNKIIKNQYHKKVIQPKRTISISGEIKFLNQEIPAKYGKITFTNLNEFNDIFETVADKKGRFIFNNLNYTDSIDFILTAVSRRNRKYIIINLDTYNISKIFFNPFSNFDSIKISRKNIFIDTSTIYLKSKSQYKFTPNQIITGKEINQWGDNNILRSLDRKIPGYSYSKGVSNLRTTNFFNDKEPLYLLNNLPADAETIENLPTYLIDRIEVIKNTADELLFGKRALNGIIAVYTIDYSDFTWGKLKEKIDGISLPKKFYEAKLFNHFYTYKWIPEIRTNKRQQIIKIPLKQGLKTVITIQGFSNNYPFYFSSEIKR